MTIHWYCAWTALKSEMKAADALHAMGFDVYLPTETVWSRKGVYRNQPSRRRKQSIPREKVERPLYDRYIFVGMEDPDAWPEATSIAEVERFLGKPTLINKDALYKLKALHAKGTWDYTTEAVWEAGEAVRMANGPFADWTGQIEEIRHGHQVKVELWNRLLQRPQTVICALDDLERVA